MNKLLRVIGIVCILICLGFLTAWIMSSVTARLLVVLAVGLLALWSQNGGMQQ